MTWRGAAAVGAALLLASCAGVRNEGGFYRGDGPPHRHVDIAAIPNAVPHVVPLSAHGNSPYKVYGKVYYPLHSAEGYRARGIASWYGTKFHGRLTASGEPYDMYAMTAAHKTLPLPSYARVTNLTNGRSVIVRINDRGPFMANRLIDLSYAAAYKLGIVATGTAPVEVDAITPGAPTMVAARQPVVSGANVRLFVQVGAFADRDNAEHMLSRLRRDNIRPALIQTAYTGDIRIYRVRVGPLPSVEASDRVIDEIDRRGISNPRLVVE